MDCEEHSDAVAQPFTRNECYGCGIPPAGAILCRNYQVRTNLQPEIATTSVRTGLAMTKRVAFPCHCEERSDVAISWRNCRVRTNLQPEIATTSVRTGLAMTD